MEEISQNRDGSGDTGSNPTTEQKVDDVLNRNSDQSEQRVSQSDQITGAIQPGASGDVVVATGNVLVDTNPPEQIISRIPAQSDATSFSDVSITTEGKDTDLACRKLADQDLPDEMNQNLRTATQEGTDPTVTQGGPGPSEQSDSSLAPSHTLAETKPVADNTEKDTISDRNVVQKDNPDNKCTPVEPVDHSNNESKTLSESVTELCKESKSIVNDTQNRVLSDSCECSEKDTNQSLLLDDKQESEIATAATSNSYSDPSKECIKNVTTDANDGDKPQEKNIDPDLKDIEDVKYENPSLENPKEEHSFIPSTELVEKISEDEVLNTETTSGDVNADVPFTTVVEGEQGQLESEEKVLKDDQVPGEEMEVDPELVAEAEDTNSDVASLGTNRKRHGSGSSVATFDESDCHGAFPAANLFEYQWPQETGAEWYMLQEQISEFLAIKSFKRKYPDLQRRSVDMNEKVFLKDRGVVSETQCDLGLTALRSEEVLDLMIRDYPMRYREYAAVLHEKERQTISDKHKEYDVPKFEKSKLADYMKKAVKSAAEFNGSFQRERREDRRAYFDLQTMAVHYPQGKYKVAPPECTKVGSYPVALIPGQFQDYYKTYTPSELRYFPVSTALYGPPKKFKETLAKPSTGDTSDDTADESGEDQGGSDSGSDDGDSSEADSIGVAPLPTPPPAEEAKPATPNGANKTDKQKSSETVAPSPGEPKRDKKEEKEVEKMCRICKLGDDKLRGKIDDLVQCSECKTSGHPTCLELTSEMITVIKTYPWQCMECKTCVECMDPYDEDKMMFCDRCDRGYHTFCVGVKSIPTGRWECPSCKDMPSKPKKSRRQTRQNLNGVPSPKTPVTN